MRYRSCKLVIEGERMQLDCTSSKNGPNYKSLKECMKIKSNLKWYGQCKVSWVTLYCFIPSRHMPLGGSIGLYAIELDLV